jgi:polar amino acid transport system substrate-binding protein
VDIGAVYRVFPVANAKRVTEWDILPEPAGEPPMPGLHPHSMPVCPLLKRFVRCFAGVWLMVLACMPGAQAQTLTVCYERADIAPWRFTDGSGLNFQLLQMAAAKAGVQLAFISLPWKRCLEQLKDNDVQGLFAASHQSDRLAFGVFPPGSPPSPSMRLHVDRYVLVRRRGDSVQWDGRHVTGLQGAVGVQLGYSVARQLRDMGLTVDEGTQAAPDLLVKLASGRVGAVALGGSDAVTLLQPGGPLAEVLEVLPLPLVEKPYFLMLSRQLVQESPDVATRLWEAIAAVRASPAYQAMERKALQWPRGAP